VKKRIAKRLKDDRHQLAVWELSGDGWKNVLKKNLDELQQSYVRSFNTPKARNLQDLYRESLGIKDITSSWARPYMTRDKARKKIDHFVTLRGSIAHRGRAKTSVTKDQCGNFLALVQDIVPRVDEHVRKHVTAIAPVRVRRRRQDRWAGRG